MTAGAEAQPDLARVWMTDRGRARQAAALRQVPGLRLVQPPLAAVGARPGRRRRGQRQAHGLGGARAGPARVHGHLLGARRRRDRGRRRAPAGAALRALPHAAGRRAGRAARDPGQGPDRPGLRRPRLLGHRDVRAAAADLHAPGGGARRAALAPRHARARPGARAPARPRRRRLPVADDRGRGVLGLLARGHRRLPHQRRHRRRRRALPVRDARRGVRGRRRAAPAGRDRAAVALARPPRPRGPVPHRRRHRAGRVLRGRQRQRLHEPDGRAEPAHGRRRRGAPLRAGARDRRRRGGDRRLARRGRRHARPVRPAARHPSAGRAASPTTT